MCQVHRPTTALGDPDAVDHHVPRVRRDPDRHRSGAELSADQPAGQPRQDPAVQRDQRPRPAASSSSTSAGSATSSRFDWRDSIKGNRPVWPELKTAIANTLVLGGIAAIVGITIGCRLRHLRRPPAALVRSTPPSTTGAFVGISIPPFVSAVILQLLFAVYLTRWFDLDEPLLPTSGVYPPGHEGFDPVLMVKHMILPVDRRGDPDRSPSTPGTCGPRCSTC